MIQLVPTVCSDISLEENLPVLAENGVKIVHLTGNHLPWLGEAEVSDIARAYRRVGVRVCAGHSWGGNLASLYEMERKKALERHMDMLHKFALMGVEIMVFHGGEVEREEQIPRAKGVLMESIAELVASAEREGVRLALENEITSARFPGGLLSPGPEVQREVIDKVNSPWLGACFDVGHANISKGVREHIETLGNRIIVIHLQDNEGRTDQHVQPPYGTVDWEEFGQALQSLGYDRPILIETRSRGGAPLRRLMQECSALLADIGLDVSGSLTLKVAGFLTGQESDLLMQCPRCGHFVLYDGRECSCLCRRWPVG